MNKAEFIESVVEKINLPKKQVTQVLDGILNTITEKLANEESVVLVGFGTFSVKTRAARKGINPQTREPMDIKEARVPGFKAGKSLKDACNLIGETVD